MATLSKDNPGLDKTGLARLWAKVKALVSKTATTTQNGLMTASDKVKLGSITNATFNTQLWVKAGQSGTIPFYTGEFLLIRVWGNLTGIQKTVVLVSAIEPKNVLTIPLMPYEYLTFAANSNYVLTVTNKSSEELSIAYCKLAYTLTTIK